MTTSASYAFVAETLARACDIQSIPAPTFHEEQRGEYFLQQFSALGLQDVQRDATGNVLGKLPGQKLPGLTPGQSKVLVVSAHMDTVHPFHIPLGVRRSEGRIYGPGIGDNALGLAAMLEMPRMLQAQSQRLPGDVWLVANVCEEGLGDLRGIQAIVDRFQGEALAYLVIEGMGLGAILHRGLGVERYKISVQTPGGHSWTNYGQPSAIHEISAIVNRLTAIAVPRMPCTSLNVGVLQGGTSVNTIAANAWLELDLRSEDSAALARLTREVFAIAYAAQHDLVRVTIERIGKRQAGQLPPTHPLVTFASSVLSGLGIEACLDIASTDANLPLSRGYPAICVGITNGNSAHTQDEYILTQPVAQGLMQLYLLITQVWDHLH